MFESLFESESERKRRVKQENHDSNLARSETKEPKRAPLTRAESLADLESAFSKAKQDPEIDQLKVHQRENLYTRGINALMLDDEELAQHLEVDVDDLDIRRDVKVETREEKDPELESLVRQRRTTTPQKTTFGVKKDTPLLRAKMKLGRLKTKQRRLSKQISKIEQSNFTYRMKEKKLLPLQEELGKIATMIGNAYNDVKKLEAQQPQPQPSKEQQEKETERQKVFEASVANNVNAAKEAAAEQARQAEAAAAKERAAKEKAAKEKAAEQAKQAERAAKERAAEQARQAEIAAAKEAAAKQAAAEQEAMQAEIAVKEVTNTPQKRQQSQGIFSKLTNFFKNPFSKETSSEVISSKPTVIDTPIRNSRTSQPPRVAKPVGQPAAVRTGQGRSKKPPVQTRVGQAAPLRTAQGRSQASRVAKPVGQSAPVRTVQGRSTAGFSTAGNNRSPLAIEIAKREAIARAKARRVGQKTAQPDASRRTTGKRPTH